MDLELIDGAICVSCDLTARLHGELANSVAGLADCERRIEETALRIERGIFDLPPGLCRELVGHQRHVCALTLMLADIECAHGLAARAESSTPNREDHGDVAA